MRLSLSQLSLTLTLSVGCMLAQAAEINTTDPAAVAAFQQGLTVQDFESIAGRTPMALSGYPGTPQDVPVAARVFDQVPSFQFSSGGAVGQVTVGLFELGGRTAGHAVSGDTVLAPLSLDNQTQFSNQAMLEAYLPVPVASLGFWVTPGTASVVVYFLNTNFAFSREEEVIHSSIVVTGGSFVGLTRDQADIGGIKIFARPSALQGFSIDDLSYGGRASNTVPEPGSAALALGALALLGRRLRGRRQRLSGRRAALR